MKKLILIAFVCATALHSSAQGYFGVKPIVNEPACFGASTGSIQLSVVGGTGPFNYAWSGSLPSTNQQTNLAAGTYSVTVTDANNLTSSYTIVVAQPFAINPGAAASNASAHGESNGYIDLNVDGGTPGYTYNWSNGATTADITGLPAGIYSCTITDAAGCTDLFTHTITQPVRPRYQGIAIQSNERVLNVSDNTDNGTKATTGMGFKGAELKATDVKVYPNPTSNSFTLLTGEVKDAQISIIDINGQIVSQQKSESNETNLNVSNLPNGNYIVEVRTESGNVVSKTVTVAK
jgi:hypothetical protein